MSCKMGTNVQVQCGICSKLVGTTECQVLDGTLKEFFETLLIKLNLDSETTFYICIDCEEKVNSTFNFKCLCIGTEDTISSYFGLDKVDLKRVLCDQEKYEHAYHDAGLEVCRLCKNFVHCNSIVSLDQILEDESIKEIFEKHIPEINLEVTENPSVCQGCQESLINFANLLFLLFDCKDKSEDTMMDSKQQFLESKESVLKKVKRENIDYSTDYSRIKKERSENNFTENMDYEIKEELTNNIEQTELQLKTEDIEQDSNESCPTTTDETDIKIMYASSTPMNSAPTYKCSECAYGTKSLPELIEHTRAHTTQLRTISTASAPLFYKCKVCGFATRQHYLLRLHVQGHIQVEAKKNREAQKNQEEAVMTNEDVLSTNEVTAQESSEINETENGEFLQDKNENPQAVLKKSEERIVMKKGGVKKIHKCPECNFETDSSSKFWAHLLTHPNYYFKKVVPSLDEKNQAKRIVFIGRTSGTLPWKKTFKCELCHYIGSNHQDFMNHVLVHVTQSKKKKTVLPEQCTIEAIHYCELCDFRTLSLDDLKVHVEVHMQA